MNNKNFILQSLLSLFIFFIISSIVFGQTTMCGDANTNGAVDIVDALIIAQCYVGIITCPPSDIGDVNCDGRINIVDALMLAQYYVGILSTLNCCSGISLTFPYTPYSYPYGLSSVSKDQATDNEYIGAVCKEYDKWKDRFVTADGADGFLRVQWPDNEVANSTVSEGMGNGMLLAVYMDDPYLLDNLWNYVMLYLNGNGLMHWRITPQGSVSGTGGATDADLNIATALLFAFYKWGSHENEARGYIDSILNHEVEIDTNILNPGDAWGGTYNPSYFVTSSMKIFADFTGNTRWLLVRDKCYEILQKAAHPETGLVPNWCDAEGNPGGGPGTPNPGEYYYDACRIPLRIAMDYLWHGDMRAKAFCDKIATFFAGVGPVGEIVNGYHLDGTVIQSADTGEDIAFTACAGAAGMAAGLTEFTSSVLDRIIDYKMNKYYQDTLRLINLLLLTGNLPDISSLYNEIAPLPTPSPTPVREDPCPPDPTPIPCPPVPTLLPIICPADNLVLNGCFDMGTANWQINLNGGDNRSSMSVQYGVLYVDVSEDPGTKEWHVKILQMNRSLELGESYVLSFDVRAQWPRTINVDIDQPAYPYNSYTGGKKTIEIGCEWQTYTINFTNNLETTTSAVVGFKPGKYQGDIYLDNVILRQVD